MAYVITQNCCKDASCVPVCPVDCIRPTSGPDGPGTTEMLYIDPDTCIDCGACMEECPVDAIHYEEDLPETLAPFADLNRAYFERHPLKPDPTPIPAQHGPVTPGELRVAIVGAGPAACYAAAALIAIDGVEVDMFERLPTPFGLVRAGVAPDHQHTKAITSIFTSAFANKRFGCHFNVEIGQHLNHHEILEHHHAVVYATGAPASRGLGLPGEQLPGSYPAADFVGWYNGHPDHTQHHFDLSTRRAVIIGNGNVALDAARILVMPQDALASTDVANHALGTLNHSAVEEVVVLGRRGPREAAFSVGEILALGQLPGVDVLIEGVTSSALQPASDDDVEITAKLTVIRQYAESELTPGNKRIIFRFYCQPVAFDGADSVTALRVARIDSDSADEVIESSLVLRSAGYRSVPLPGLPFDDTAGRIPQESGRVIDQNGHPVAGVYVAGWVKRGPRGVIGTNRVCADETVASLLEDFDRGSLKRDVPGRDVLPELLHTRGVTTVDWNGWRAIDTAERKIGLAQSRPRVKFTSIDEMINAVRNAPQ